MKKTIMLSLVLAFCAGTTAFAQEEEEYNDTFLFCYEDGTIIPNGSTINLSTTTLDPQEDPETGEIVYTPTMFTGIYVKNTVSVVAYAGIDWNVTRMDGGSMSVCFPEMCMNAGGVGQVRNSGGDIRPNEIKSTTSEWYPAPGVAGEAEVTMQLTIWSKGQNQYGIPVYTYEDFGPTITLHFIYDGLTAGVSEVSSVKETKEVARYTIDGQQLAAPQKGINIVKLASGTTKKVLVK